MMLRRLAAAVAIWTAAALAAAANCAPTVLDLRSDGAQNRFSVELAVTPAERARGLMHRTDLPASSGMLFLIDPPQHAAFWMKNTPLSLDLIFIDAQGVVIRVTENATPFSEAAMPSGAPVRAVLEVNAGLADRYRIAEGTQVRHPAFADADPVWPCG